MPVFHYRLQTLLDRKLEQKQEAERALAQKRKDLRDAEERLAELRVRQGELEADRTERRASLLCGASSGEEIRRRRDDVSLAARRVEDVKDEVMAQRIQIENCREQAETAASALASVAREAEVLTKHRSRGERRWNAEMERKEAIEQDEIASALHQARRRQ